MICPSEVMSRYSTSGKNFGSTQVAFGFLMLGELRLGTDYGIELLADLAGDRAGPTRPDLAHIAQLFALLLTQVERGDAGGVFDKSDNRKRALRYRLDFQPGLSPFRSIRCIRALRDDAFPV